MLDTLIIGSGPAGLTAAIYAKRAGLSLSVIEKNAVSGGQILNTWEVDNYPGLPGINGFDLGMKFREHADKLSIDFIEGEAVSLTPGTGSHRVRTDSSEEYEARTVIIASGAVHAALGVTGEDKFNGKGVSYCATCDGGFFSGKDAVVVGGGDVAVEDAIYLSRICGNVSLIHRRDELRASNILKEELLNTSNIKVQWNSIVKEIRGDAAVSSVVLENVVTKELTELDTSAVFIAVGIRPDTAIVRDIVSCDDGGYIIAGEDCATSVPGIFAAGDARKKRLRQVITAAADGANAATSAADYINRH